ncbi:MAG TPA: hypothetical protein VGF28_06165 [Thermoanaerobaculia bacterium]|jgi:hypothetical protein
MRSIAGFVLGVVLGWPQIAAAACGLDRWPVKTASDVDAALIHVTALPAAIQTLQAIPPPRPLPQDRRVAPVETTVYSVIATMVAYRITPESTIELVLSDEAGRTMLAQIPDPACAAGSRFLEEISDTRRRFLTRYTPAESFAYAAVPVDVRGVGFFDFLQGQRGGAPNGIALSPVIDIDYTPTPRPKPPPGSTSSKRRAVRKPAGCSLPTVTLTSGAASVCTGESTTISWQASDPAATVSIDGIGAALPASGSRSAAVAVSTVYSGRAANACGVGPEAVAVVTMKAEATAALTGPGTLREDSSASLHVTITGATSWTLTSSLGNPIEPSSGTHSGTARYTGTRTGTDVVTLVTAGGGCGSVRRTITIIVTPDIPTGGLLCCDGTRSPTCFSCTADKRGCCSGHGGICGCPSATSDSSPP